MSTSTRDRILDSARTLLEAQPWEGLKLSDVAAAAGVSRQAIYLHFGSRSALLFALVDHVDRVEGLAELVTEVRDAETGTEQLQRLAALNARYEPRIHAVATAHDIARRADDELEAAWQDRMHARRALYRQVAQRLADEHRLVPGLDVGEAADLLQALLSPRVFEELAVDRDWQLERYERELGRILTSALVKPASETASTPGGST